MGKDTDETTKTSDNRQIPWHRLATKVTQATNAVEALSAAHLDWTVAKKAIFSDHGPVQLSGRDALVREDLWKDNKGGLLGTVREGYTPMQNSEAFNFLDPIVQSGAAFYDSAGDLAQGDWVWIMLRFAGDLEVAQKDLVARFLLFGSRTTTGYHRLAYLPVRLLCKNTLGEGHFHNPPPTITIPNVRPRRFEVPIEVAVREIEARFEAIARQFRAMVGVQLSTMQLQKYLDSVFERELKSRSLRSKQIDPEEIAAEQEGDRLHCIRLFAEGKGNDLPDVRGTLWAAVSAVSEYVDFYKLSPSDPNYLNEIWFNQLKARALQIAREMLA